MASHQGWENTNNVEQQLEASGRHTLVTFPKSQKSIVIEWEKIANTKESGYNFVDDGNLEGIFFYDDIRLRMTYERSYYHYSYNGKETKGDIPRQERENLPCKYLILGIIKEKAEIKELATHDDEQVCSICLGRGYMDEPGDMHDALVSCSIRYEFNLSEMSCSYSYNYFADLAP